MVIHFKVAGHLACGHHGSSLPSSAELNRVKCRTCRNTEAYKEARRTQRNARSQDPHLQRLAQRLGATLDRPARVAAPATRLQWSALRVIPNSRSPGCAGAWFC